MIFFNADHLRMDGTDGSIFAIGDCTATTYAPTAQVASQQGAYLARMLAQMAKKDVLEEKLATLEGATSNVTSDEERRQITEEMDSALRQLAKVKLRPFHYSHQGSLAYVFSRHRCVTYADQWVYRYIGSEKAIADLPFMNGNVSLILLNMDTWVSLYFVYQVASGGVATYLFWRSAYLSTLFSLRNRTLVATDWMKVKLFGRSVNSLCSCNHANKHCASSDVSRD
jgi:NADH:ubiquinone reductase (non-electrogenic)